MFSGKQRTIVNKVSCSGSTLCKKNKSTVNFLPAKVDTGIIFKRIDIKGKNNEVKAIYSNIANNGNRGITIANKDGVKVSNVEHILSVVWGSMIDNLIIEVDCQELPIVDGSTEPFLFLIQSAGIKTLEKQRKIIEIKKEIEIKEDNRKVSIKPSRSFIVKMDVDLNGNGKFKESFVFDNSIQPYKDTISRARSFSLEYKAKEVDKANYIHKSEFAKHKILDCTGAFYLAGYYIQGEIECLNSGCDLYEGLLKKIFADEENFAII